MSNDSMIPPQEDTQDERVVSLTKREVEVLSLVLEGKSSKEVADVLVCSKRTVDFHLTRIYDKLNVSNRVQAMRRAALLGLLDVNLAQKHGHD
ncbi:MAG: helix-turn-helix transcriptional regulator [Armatimonadota bacterium]|nr:helix-turn-helix transcriptional regulator [bacterium]